MASTYSNLAIELIGTGDQDGTWGISTNNNLQYALQEAIANTANVAITGGAATDTMAWSTSSNLSQPARFLRLNLTGTGGTTGNLIVPTLSGGKNYYIKNSSDTAVTVKTVAGSGILVPAGKSMSLYQDGTNVVEAANYSASYTIASGVIDNATIGVTTPNTGAFTTLSASSTVSGAGMTARFATPGPIGNTSASTGAFTDTTLGTGSGSTVTHNAKTVTIPNDLIFSGTGTISTPVGSTAQRPGSASNGMLRYNSTLSQFEGYAASAWGQLVAEQQVLAVIQFFKRTNL